MNKYISIKVILDRLLRHPLLQDLQFEAAVEYALDFMRIVGVPKMFEESVCKVKIKNYRGELPEGLYKILGVRQGDIYFKYSGYSFMVATQQEIEDTIQNNDIAENYVEVPHFKEYLKTFEFKNAMKAYYTPKSNSADYTYKVQGNYIFTGVKEGTIEVAYLRIRTDEDGYPMVLDNSSYLRALQAYIKKEWFTILFDIGQIQGPVLQNVQQEYAWAVGDCESEFNRLTLDQAEYFYNSMKNIINENHHKYGFKYLGG